MKPTHVAGCSMCKDNAHVDLPQDLVDSFADGKVVLFVGAGASTESRVVRDDSFYDEIADELPNVPKGLSFPSLMTAFEKANGRPALLRKFKERLDYMEGFSDLRNAATRFHEELGSVPQIKEIITTNWDPYFEEVCGATPIVVAADYAFWDMPGRKVFKIHGSIWNPSTIVATEDDFRRCYRRLQSGTIGATLKHLLATKRVVFVGYSLRDPDFTRLYAFLGKEMGDVLPRSYIVTTSTELSEFSNPATMVFNTDSAYFIHILKEELLERDLIISDERFDLGAVALDQAIDAHLETVDRISLSRRPDVLYCLSYQDGLIHSLKRILRLKGTGEYSDPHRVKRHLIPSYGVLRGRALSLRRYWDVAYIDGYVNGLLVLNEEFGELLPPPLYVFGAGDDEYPESIWHLQRLLTRAPELHKTAHATAVRIVRRYEPGVVIEHTPFLDGLGG